MASLSTEFESPCQTTSRRSLRSAAGEEWLFACEVDSYSREYAAWWRHPGNTFVVRGPRVHVQEKRRRERATETLIARFEQAKDEDRSAGEVSHGQWLGLGSQLRTYISHALEYPEPCQRLLLSGAYRRVTCDFVRRARAFDPHLGTGDLFQALRNVWIANSLQILLRRPVRLTPPVFAYSLLYPYTDNYCDHPRVTSAEKCQMTNWLGRRLRGLSVSPTDRRGQHIVRLVAMIEGTWPREQYPEVHQSLCCIHRAQVRSLRQQDPRARLSNDELLKISLEKGGTSVLADGYLVAGRLRPATARFLFGYGAMLQLLDDLEDAHADALNGHDTLFSRAVPTGSLDAATERLARFIQHVCWTSYGFTGRSWPMLRSLIERSSSLQIVQAIARHPDSFSDRFRTDMERHSPWRFAWLKQQQEKLDQRHAESRSSPAELKRLETLLDALVTTA